MSMQRREFLVPVPGSSTLDPEAPLYQIKAFSRSLEVGAVLSTSYFTVQPSLDDDEAGCVALACCGQSRIDPCADDGLTQAKSLQSQCWQRFARLVHGSAESRHMGQKLIGANSPRHKLHQLCNKHFSKIHEKSRKLSTLGHYLKMQNRDSNRHQIKLAANPHGYWPCVKTELRWPDTTDSTY